MPSFLPFASRQRLAVQRPVPVPQRPVPVPQRLPQKKALLVGINYIGTNHELSGCINDTASMENLLRSSFGYSRFEIQTDVAQVKPTRANILAGLSRLVIGAAPGDTLFFLYSGHGTLIRDRNGDEATKMDSAIVSLDFSAILDDELRNIFTRVPAGVQVFCIVDACHSGTAFDLRYQYTDESGENLKQTLTEYKQYPKTPANIMMLSACLDSQYAADTYENNKFCGALTWAFLEVIKVNGMKFKYLLKDVAEKLKAGGYSQRPQLSCGNATNAETLLNF